MLTKREYEVLKLMAEGKTNNEIAKELFLSDKTVKNHIAPIFKKLNVKDRTNAVIKFLKDDIPKKEIILPEINKKIVDEGMRLYNENEGMSWIEAMKKAYEMYKGEA